MEISFSLICNYSDVAEELWVWAKPELQNKKSMYGNLYTKGISAAKAVQDNYAIQLEKEYAEWKKRVGL